jgi:uncharacterized protein (DUF1697 family)
VPAYVALLRGINLVKRNRVAMADLRALLEAQGYGDVRTHLQSGNAVFSAPTRSAAALESVVEKAIGAELGLTIRVLVRTAAQMAKVVATDPLGARATDHARYMVVFLDRRLPASALSDVDPAAYEPEEFALVGRELYLWLPKGSHDSRLARAVTDKRLGVTGTMRNWNTVRRLAELAGG